MISLQRKQDKILTETIMKTKKILLSLIAALAICFCFASCDNSHDTEEMSVAATTASWEYYPDEQPVGYYKRYSVVKDDETFEEMLELRETANKGYLVLKDDWTAYFELDGEITEYTYDRKNLYLKEDTEKNNGFSYVHINGRLIVDYGSTTEQYMILSDDELADYLEHGSDIEIDKEKKY